ncbi:MAG: DUF1579 family protein [Vicinamibacterales bacterium]
MAFCVMPATSVVAQSRPDVAAQREAMQKLAFLVGRWTGEATVATGPEGPRRVEQTEDVQFKLDGLVLLIEGTGRNPVSGAVEFNALATVSFDEASGAYRFRAYSGGNYVETVLTLRDRGLEWGFTAGPATVTNTMHLDDTGQWVEVTDVVINGGPPRRTTELRVRKQVAP